MDQNRARLRVALGSEKPHSCHGAIRGQGRSVGSQIFKVGGRIFIFEVRAAIGWANGLRYSETR
jgi:hypothetical protein